MDAQILWSLKIGEDDTIGAPIIFNGVSLTYLNAGLLIRFNGYPIEYSSIPDVFAFTTLFL